MTKWRLQNLFCDSQNQFLQCFNVPWKIKKKLNEVNKTLHPSTNPEILVKIGPLASETQMLESRPLKKKTKKIKTTRNVLQRLVYSLVGAVVSPPSEY